MNIRFYVGVVRDKEGISEQIKWSFDVIHLRNFSKVRGRLMDEINLYIMMTLVDLV